MISRLLLCLFLAVKINILLAQDLEVRDIGVTNVKLEGIQWTEKLTWKEVLKEAKRQKKYVFVDCYTTWCGPCKAMDKDVFQKKEVGDFFNENFISVRLQMDRTAKDDSRTRRWYNVAQYFDKEFGIASYPTFIFFSPEGEIINRTSGYKGVRSFMNFGQATIKPGYVSPYLVYYRNLLKYVRGKKDYSIMAGLADTAKLLNQEDVAQRISGEYRPYLMSLKRENWYTVANLSFMARFVDGSSDPFFSVFYREANRVDSIMRWKGFADYVVDTIIQREEIERVVNFDKGLLLSSNKPTEKPEPDWGSLQRRVALKYDSLTAERNVLKARIQWYNDQHDWAFCARYIVIYLKRFPPDYINSKVATFLNYIFWDAIFKRSVDKEQIDMAAQWMAKVVEKFPTVYELIDTYANLLYKSGNVHNAIRFEEIALANSPGHPEIQATLKRMKEGKPTWPYYISKDFWDSGVSDIKSNL